MPEDTDDDIVDLLEVVQVGKKHVAGTGPLEPDLEDELDALLLENAQAVGAPPAADALFPDPTPVDHQVDPDEELEMPSMDDLNSLLASLGAPAPSICAPDDEGVLPPGCPDPDAVPLVMPDPQRAAVPSRTPDTSAAAAPAVPPVPLDDPFEAVLAKAEPAVAPAVPLDDPFEAALAKAEPAVAPPVPLDDPFEAALAKAEPAAAPAVPLDDPFEAALAKAEPAVAPAVPLDDPFEAALAKAEPAAAPAVPLDDPFEAALAKAEPAVAPAVPLDDPFEAALAKAEPAAAPAVPLDDPFEAALAKAEPAAAPAVPLDDPFEAADAEAADAAVVEAVADSAAAVARVEDALLAQPVLEESAVADAERAVDLPLVSPDAVPVPDASVSAEAEESEEAAEPVGEDIDLHELDALLDDMLAVAPVSGTSILSSSESRGPLAPAAAYAVPSGGEREVAVRMEAVEGALEALRTEVSLSVRTELGALHAALGTLGQELHAAIELVQGVKVSSEHAEGAGGVPLLHAGGQDSFPGTDHAGELAALQAELAEQKELAQRQQDALQELHADFTMLHANLDKLAAEAAAKVIREELRGLLQTIE